MDEQTEELITALNASRFSMDGLGKIMDGFEIDESDLIDQNREIIDLLTEIRDLLAGKRGKK